MGLWNSRDAVFEEPHYIPAGGGCQASDPAYWRVFGKLSNGKHVIGCGASPEEALERAKNADIKPEGFWVEIADLCIRIADVLGALGWERTHTKYLFTPPGLPEFVMDCHEFIKKMTMGYNWAWSGHAGPVAMQLMEMCILTAANHGVDLLELCELKMQYNSTRPVRHGGKRS